MNHSSKHPLFLYRALYIDPLSLSLSQTDLLEKLQPFRVTVGSNRSCGPGEAHGPRPWSPMTPPFKGHVEHTLPLNKPVKIVLPTKAVVPPTKTAHPVQTVVHCLGHASGSLLRCIYTAVHGEPTSFESYTINQEMNERQKMALYFRDRTKELKDRSHRLTNMDVEELLSDLMTMTTRKNSYNSCFGEIFVPLSQTVVYSRFYQRIIHIVCEDIHTYTTFEPVGEPTGPPIYILFHRNQNSFEWKEGWGGSDFVSSLYLKMENFRMALKPLSQYKMEDLNHIINLLGLGGGGERMKKKDLYTLIQNHVLCLV